MIRVALMAVGFVGATLALIWTLGGGEDDARIPDQVSRSTPDVMGLQPSLTPAMTPAVTQPAPAVAAAPAAPAPVAAAPKVAPAAQDKVGYAVEAMGYGILEELKKPVQAPVAAPAAAPEVASIAPVEVPAPVAPARVYTVQPGDSLPGIAFRFYGSTVGYLRILDANQDVVRNPADLRAGMVLTIPE